MSVRRLVRAACLLPAILVPAGARRLRRLLQSIRQGYKLEGGRLEPSGTKVAASVQLESNVITQIGDRFFLTRARQDVLFDAQNVELTSGCDLPTRPPPMAH